ncbi:hypothetical protein UZ36_04910 [Candidatus Nitromaritima sp. SCGC AAA799-C22]|nr:hypothetical protein UZ36_04910 [Candidatus Nitromaritima sp. SCGC AAA799-C22]
MNKAIEEIAEEQYACRLGIFKQEISETCSMVMERIDFVLPAIRSEISFLESNYRVPAEAGDNEMAVLEELVEDLEENRILLEEFFQGYKNGDTYVPGYNELRCMGGILSKYQYYENPPDAYREIKGNFFEYCKALEPFLKDKKSNPEFSKFYDQVRDRSRTIKKMSDIFEMDVLVGELEKRVQVKYSYDQNIKNARFHLEKFEKRKKDLIEYNLDEIKKAEKELEGLMKGEEETNRFNSLMKEVKQEIKKRSIPFSKLEAVFKKIKEKNFNILIGQQDVKDVSISITPHHEKKYGRGILERINTIILEVDFWYPPGMKKTIFDNISETTQKIQADEPVDKQEFLKLMQKYDRDLESKVRATYSEKVKDLQSVYTALNKLYMEPLNRKKLEQRLANTQIWGEIKPKIDEIEEHLKELASGKPEVAKNIDKFIHIRKATNGLCNVLFDLSMQLFILFHGVDGKTITKMTNTLAVFKEAHDAAGLWATFSHYFKKNAIPNFQVNHSIILQNARLPTTKAGLNKLK